MYGGIGIRQRGAGGRGWVEGKRGAELEVGAGSLI